MNYYYYMLPIRIIFNVIVLSVNQNCEFLLLYYKLSTMCYYYDVNAKCGRNANYDVSDPLMNYE